MESGEFGFDAVNGTLTKNVTDISSHKLFEGYPPGLLAFASAACLVYMLVGVPGNLITIIALARCKKVRNATAVFIINLSLSDLLFCCFNLPLAASTYWFSAWTHGDLLCRLFPLLRYGLSAVSLFTVLAITLNRYVMIGHPRIYPKIYRRRYLGVMVAATWICAFSALIPTWRGKWGRFGLDRSIGSCSILPDKNNTSPKDFFFLMAFVVPCVAIVVCYARIFYIVRKTAMRSHEPALQNRTLAGSMIIPSQKSQPRNNNVSEALQMATLLTDDVHKQLLERTNGHHQQTHTSRRVFEMDGNSGSSEQSTSTGTCHTHPLPLYGPKIMLKFIDSSVDSEMPPSFAALGSDIPGGKRLSAEQRNLSSVSMSRNVEFRDDVSGGLSEELGNGTEAEDEHELTASLNPSQNSSGPRRSSLRKMQRVRNGTICMEVDSAVEESTSSSENNQIYHIRSESNCNNIVSVQVEPSSSSGIDLPLDEESPPSRIHRTIASSIRRIKRSRNRRGDIENTLGKSGRKHSAINTSGASILYPGRMSTKDRRLLKMILVILVSFITCYLPITASKFVRPIQEISYLNIMGYLLIYLTTCINPIIYVVMSSEYRQAYWNLLMCRLTPARRLNHKELLAPKGSMRHHHT